MEKITLSELEGKLTSTTEKVNVYLPVNFEDYEEQTIFISYGENELSENEFIYLGCLSNTPEQRKHFIDILIDEFLSEIEGCYYMIIWDKGHEAYPVNW